MTPPATPPTASGSASTAPSDSASGPARTTTRAERRRATEARILAAARRLFAEVGYERATVRAIAAAAYTDPSLVTRYFGSKEALFQQVARMAPDDVSAETIEGIAEQLLAALADKLSDEPTDVMAVLRSMFTRPEAVVEAREAMLEQQRRTAERIDGEAPDLRAGLVGAITIGAVVGRHLLGLDGLRDASPEQVVAMLRPAFHELLGVPNPPSAPNPPNPPNPPAAPNSPAAPPG
ncbi:TetR family transcriptional regulator [Streptomyces sp. NBC_00669]|uniref:TetR/AcrR family transcriptional regulator n=1 Tax=Streptomyces sp. NBC_00669 TaxID=2976011 RepID=UPI002E329434|nr:TetR family transcriptional regulator [Streptomyces sp. NBC_00669]